MINTSIYSTLVSIAADGVMPSASSSAYRQISPIPSAQTYFSKFFEGFDVDSLSHKEIQLRLLDLYTNQSNQSNDEIKNNAQRCLLCFISWEIEKVCLNLEKQFGATGGFTCRDLLPYVLDDDGRLQSKSPYQCYSLKILNSFDINQSSLSSWTSRKVKQHPGLSKFLLECGIYLLSDWAILNDTQPKQLERILSQFHSLSVTEIQQYKWLLQSYHTVYRAQRLQQRKSRKTSKCQPPSIEQLEQISDKLNNLSQGKYSYEANNLMSQLQQLAGYLREYRIHVRGGSLAKESIDAADTNNNSSVSNIPAINHSENEAENQTSEFLKLYRPQFIECLDNALATVTETRVNKIHRKDSIKAKKFLTGLELFHCQGLSMTEIAKRIEMKAQFQVTRLLKLKELRADVTNELLALLKNRVLDLAKNYASLEKLQALESQITIALTEQVTNLIAEAEIEASASRSNLTRSRFASRLCEYLDSRKQ